MVKGGGGSKNWEVRETGQEGKGEEGTRDKKYVWDTECSVSYTKINTAGPSILFGCHLL